MYAFIGWQKFFDQLKQVRILNLIGPMGTGKTCLGVAIGYHLKRLGYVMTSAFNLPVSFGEHPQARWCYGLLDEAGLLFDARDSFKSRELNRLTGRLLFKLRKDGSYLAVPSFIEVDKRFREGVRIWRVSAFGSRLWFYHWELGPEEAEERRPGINFFEGTFTFVNPRHFFGAYDTYFAPGRSLSYEFLYHLLRENDRGVHDAARKAV